LPEFAFHARENAGLEGKFAGTCVADEKVLFHQPGLLGIQPPIEEIVQPAEGLLAGVPVQSMALQRRRDSTLPQRGQAWVSSISPPSAGSIRPASLELSE
jgi:hypothetical protein